MAKQSVHAVIYKDGRSDRWVAHCLEYDVGTLGDNPEHALEMIQEAVELHLEDLTAEELAKLFIPVGSEPTVRSLEIHAPAVLQP
jgi:predicted RNase H-like HicB family nuclease